MKGFLRVGVSKFVLLVRTIVFYVMTKLKYGSQISFHIINNIKGNIKVELLPDSNLKIGSFFMSEGPCYIKCLEHGNLTIGDRCFLKS